MLPCFLLAEWGCKIAAMRHSSAMMVAVAITMLQLVTGQNMSLTASTRTYPNFYEDEKVTLSCRGDGFAANDIDELHFVASSASGELVSTCKRNSTGHFFNGTNGLRVLYDFEHLGISSCGSYDFLDNTFRAQLEGTITRKMENVSFTCEALRFSGGPMIKSTAFNMSLVYRKPSRLSIRVPREDDVKEGRPFSFICRTYGGRPRSHIDYRIYRNNYMVQSSAVYTPTKDDRTGLNVRCVDRTHHGLRFYYKHLVEQRVDLLPIYVDGPFSRALTIASYTHEEVKFECDAESNHPLDYEWTCDPPCVIDSTGRFAYYGPNSVTERLSAEVTCKATLKGTSDTYSKEFYASYTNLQKGTVPPEPYVVQRSSSRGGISNTAIATAIICTFAVLFVGIVAILFVLRHY